MKTANGSTREAAKRAVSSEPLLPYVLRRLTETKGTWGSISRETGVPYFTIAKIASGHTKNPRINTLQPLADHFQHSAA